jgi:penicillin amidase
MGFSVRDLMCITRLASSDLSWMYYTKFLKLAELEGWQDVLALARHQVAPALSDTGEQLSLQSLLRDYSKSGSNSVVVAGTRSRSGSALIANDPHVGLTLPNFWLMVGLKSPDYHAFGLMIPGIPVIGVGRNPDIAWGGTNMRGISSHLYDVSTVPTEQIRVRRESKVRRFWFDSEHVVRETAYGNIFSDVDYFSVAQPLALDWIGHRGSDELTTFLDIARARDWDEFRSAFDRYRISAMNMLYADRWGNIGMIAAYGQPVLRAPERTLDLVKQTDNPIVSVLAPTGHHIEHNPEAGFIASANNRPPSDRAIPFSFAYANNDRAQRLTELVQRQPLLGFEELRALQLDTHSASALQLVRLLVSRMSVAERPLEHPLYSHLLRWNGNFDHANPDALACEMVLHFAWQSYLDAFRERPAIHHYLSGLDGWKPVLLEWLQGLPQDQLESLFAGWLAQAVEVSRDYASWGAFHRQIQAPVLARLPLVGARFALDTYPADGNNDTLNKSGRRPGTEPSVVTYGASARHISDLASLDENYFVLHGGQDGWLMNPNLADQTTLWRAGQYIRIPLDMDKVRAQFTAHVTRIEPE